MSNLFRKLFKSQQPNNNQNQKTTMEKTQIKPEQKIEINGMQMVIIEVKEDTMICKNIETGYEAEYDIETLKELIEPTQDSKPETTETPTEEEKDQTEVSNVPTPKPVADSTAAPETPTPVKPVEDFQPTFPGANVLFYANEKFLETFKESVGDSTSFPATVNGIPQPGQTLLNITVYVGSDKVDLKGVPHISAVEDQNAESFWVKTAI